MKYFIIAFAVFSSCQVFSQKTDTVFSKKGGYVVFSKDANGKIQGTKFFYNKEHDLIKTIEYIDSLKNGLYIDYSNNIKQQVFTYKNDIKEGEAFTFYPNGNIAWTYAFKDDKFTGQTFIRDSIGQPLNGNFKADFAEVSYNIYCINGLPQGQFIMLNSSGNIIMKGIFSEGYPDGVFKFFDKKGNVIREEHYEKGRFLKEIKSDPKAQIENFSEQLTLNPKNKELLLGRAEAYILEKNYDLAKTDLIIILEIDSSYLKALYNLGYIYSIQKKYKLAEQYFIECTRIDDNFYPAFYNLGYIAYQANQNAEALKYFTSAIKANRKYADAYYNRSKIYKSLGNNKKSEKDMRKFERLNSKVKKNPSTVSTD